MPYIIDLRNLPLMHPNVIQGDLTVHYTIQFKLEYKSTHLPFAYMPVNSTRCQVTAFRPDERVLSCQCPDLSSPVSSRTLPSG